MPLYDYKCPECGHFEENMHLNMDHGPQECPECEARMWQQLGSVNYGMQFKGSGWTDGAGSDKRKVE